MEKGGYHNAEGVTLGLGAAVPRGLPSVLCAQVRARARWAREWDWAYLLTCAVGIVVKLHRRQPPRCCYAPLTNCMHSYADGNPLGIALGR